MIWLLYAAGAGFDLWYVLAYASGMGFIPQTEFFTRTWMMVYDVEQNMLNLVLPQLPIALAVAMSGRRERAEIPGPLSIPKEPYIEPSP